MDDRGRVPLPPRWREALGDPVRLWYALDGQINVCSLDVWRQTAETVSGLNQALRAARDLTRMVLSADECPVDKQGRILIPAFLRRDAGLQDNLVILGVKDHLEIWALEHWLDRQNRMRDERALLADQLAEKGLFL